MYKRLCMMSSLAVLSVSVLAQSPVPADWRPIDAETLRHFRALVQMDTSDPPGHETLAAEYIQRVLEGDGITTHLYESEPGRANLVARLKGNGRKRPLLLMAHTDTVGVDPSKWTFPPFSAAQDHGYIYGRGTLDDKDNLTAALMTMLLLKRNGVALDRDVIFLAEAGEEAATRVGIEYIVNNHFDAIDAEVCLAEDGRAVRTGGRVQFVEVPAAEKSPHPLILTAAGTSGHGSRPLMDNPVVHLAAAVAALGAWKPPIQLNETTRLFFSRLATFSSPADAARYHAIVGSDPKAASDAVDYLALHDPAKASLVRTSLSPTMFSGGMQVNVIPSQATASIDVRFVPGEDADAFLAAVRKVVNDPLVTATYSGQNARPDAAASPIDTDTFRTLSSQIARAYDTTAVPSMETSASDKAFLRARGMLCYGIGPGVDLEDVAAGFGMHSDQERILESELYRFVRFNYDTVVALAGTK